MDIKPPAIVDAFATIEEVRAGASLARFGDGELRLCLGERTKFQAADIDLQLRLLHVLRSPLERLLVGVPYLSSGRMEQVPDHRRDRWRAVQRRLIALWDPNLTYCDAFVSRPDALGLVDSTAFYRAWISVWEGRKVVVVQNAEASADNPACFDGPVTSIEVPKVGAWAVYGQVLEACLAEPPDRLFLLSAGPLATILAYDLCHAGRQAVDIGHLTFFRPLAALAPLGA